MRIALQQSLPPSSDIIPHLRPSEIVLFDLQNHCSADGNKVRSVSCQVIASLCVEFETSDCYIL